MASSSSSSTSRNSPSTKNEESRGDTETYMSPNHGLDDDDTYDETDVFNSAQSNNSQSSGSSSSSTPMKEWNALANLRELVKTSTSEGTYVTKQVPYLIHNNLNDFIAADPNRKVDGDSIVQTWALGATMTNMLVSYGPTREIIRASYAAIPGHRFDIEPPFTQHLNIGGVALTNADAVAKKVASQAIPQNLNDNNGRNFRGVSAITAFHAGFKASHLVTIAIGVIMASKKSLLTARNIASIDAMHGTVLDPEIISKLGFWASKVAPDFAQDQIGLNLKAEWDFYKFHTTVTATPGLIIKFIENVSPELVALIPKADIRYAREDIKYPSNPPNIAKYSVRALATVYCYESANGSSFAPDPAQGSRPQVWFQGFKACQQLGSAEIRTMITTFRTLNRIRGRKVRITDAPTMEIARVNAVKLLGGDLSRISTSALKQASDFDEIAKNKRKNPLAQADMGDDDDDY